MSDHRFHDEWLAAIAREVLAVPVQDILAARTKKHRYLATALLDGGTITSAGLLGAVRERYGCEVVTPDPVQFDRSLFNAVPERICRQYRVLPLRVDDTHVHVATANPADVRAEDDIAFASGRRPVFAYCLPDHLETLLASALNPDEMVQHLLRKLEVSQHVELMGDAELEIADGRNVGAPVVELVNAIIARAVTLGASDIHIEHEKRRSQVRYRVDGKLRTGIALPLYLAAGPLTSRLKIMGGLDVADRLRPQDGQASIRVGTLPMSLRISTLPTNHGEKVVVRLLDPRNVQAKLGDLGFRPEMTVRLERLLTAKQGFVLVTGPTGSGKTTTLYAAILSRADGDTNIVSIEDPIEYQLAGINQVQVNERQNLTFPSVLRSVLRQDPDVILVGEIRDAETATVACRAAMTGHLVLSTIHANDTVSAVTRLADMGVDRRTVVSSLRGVTAQRLVRKLCDCRTPIDLQALPPPVLQALRESKLVQRAFGPAGCQQCEQTGYRGRVPIVALLEITPAVAERMAVATTAAELRDIATAAGVLQPLGNDALWHLSEGRVSGHDILPYLDGGVEEGEDNPPAFAKAAIEPDDDEDNAPASVGAKVAAPRVLVADHDASRRAQLSEWLVAAGYEVEHATNGASAVALLTRQTPNALITALDMPIMSGADLIRYVRGSLCLPSLPVIVVTDYDGRTPLDPAIEAEVAEVLPASGVSHVGVLVRAVVARSRDYKLGERELSASPPAAPARVEAP